MSVLFLAALWIMAPVVAGALGASIPTIVTVFIVGGLITFAWMGIIELFDL